MDEVDQLKIDVTRYRLAMISACSRFEDEDKGTLETRNGLAWAMWRDLRRGLGIPATADKET